MNEVDRIRRHDISNYIENRVNEVLSGLSLNCARNALQYLQNASSTVDISTALSYFCVTHSTEEAVASVLAVIKEKKYFGKLKRKINDHNHAHKSVVVAFARMIAVHLEEAGAAFTYNKERGQIIIRYKEADDSISFRVLSADLFDYNGDQSCSGEKAFDHFKNLHKDQASIIDCIRKMAKSRNDALYATEKILPQANPARFPRLLWEHSIITLALLWLACEIFESKEKIPVVIQLVSAVAEVCKLMDPKRSEPCPDQ